MRIATIAVAIGFVLSSCTSTRIVATDAVGSHSDSLSYSEVQKRLCAKPVRVVLVNDHVVSGIVDQVSRDSVRLVDRMNASAVVVPTSTVLRIERVDRIGGVFGGFLAGALGGMILGGAVGASLHPPSGEMHGFGVALCAVGGACLGAVAGTLFGGFHGIVEMYQFRGESDTHSSLQSVNTSTPWIFLANAENDAGTTN